MRKRSIAAAGIMVMCLGLMACGSASNTGSSNTATQAASTSSAGYVYTSNGTDIKINDDVNAIVSKLGTPKGGTYEAKSCAFDGMDKFWYYDGFTLQAYQNDGKDVVYSVTFTDDTVKTKEGVKIGDSKDKVTQAYGSSFKENNGQLVYESGNMKLSFGMKDNKVQSVIYELKQ